MRLLACALGIVLVGSSSGCSSDDGSKAHSNAGGSGDSDTGGTPETSGSGGGGAKNAGGSKNGSSSKGGTSSGGSRGSAGSSGTASSSKGGMPSGGSRGSAGSSGTGGGAEGGAPGAGGAEGGGAGAAGAGSASSMAFGKPYEGGQFNLGPVDYDETQWHNACAPGTKYAPVVQMAEGTLLAGLWNGIPNVAGYCDACISVTTAKGKSAVLRVVTYGDTSTNSIDVSPDAFALLDTGEYPRSMTWEFVECADTGKTMYEFQTGSSEYWTSFWLRNARIPLSKVEVMSANHSSYVTVVRGTDGTLTDGKGFGKGSFTIRATGVDGRQLEDTFTWPASGIAGAMLTGKGNFD